MIEDMSVCVSKHRCFNTAACIAAPTAGSSATTLANESRRSTCIVQSLSATASKLRGCPRKKSSSPKIPPFSYRKIRRLRGTAGFSCDSSAAAVGLSEVSSGTEPRSST